MVYIVRYKNYEVTDYYLDIIKDAFLELGYEVKNTRKIEDKSQTSIIVVSTIIDVFKYYFKGYHNIFLWMQGIDPEESYLKHHSIIKKTILELITYFSLKVIKGVFFVSNEMKNYVEKKYNKKNNCFIMPCFNTSIDVDSFTYKNKYNKNIFTYVGSLSKWQCFNETVELYKKIEENIKDTQLKVYTFSVEEAKKVLKEKNVKNYVVEKVSPNEISTVLKEAKFGFTLRNDIAVNNVATPTKLSSYLSAGVIPIFSMCIRDFYENTLDKKFVIPIDSFENIPINVLRLCKEKINADDIYREYQEIFSTYYNRESYKENMKKWLGGILNETKNK